MFLPFVSQNLQNWSPPWNSQSSIWNSLTRMRAAFIEATLSKFHWGWPDSEIDWFSQLFIHENRNTTSLMPTMGALILNEVRIEPISTHNSSTIEKGNFVSKCNKSRLAVRSGRKSTGQETGLGNRELLSEGSEWYQFGPKWAWVTPSIIHFQFGIIQNLRMSPIPQSTLLPWTFFRLVISKTALVYCLVS